MIGPVLGISVNTVFQKPHATAPVRRLEFLQNKDVFFSTNSYRAQLSCFLNNKTSKPLMFSYVHSDQKTLWDRLAPATKRDVIVLTRRIEGDSLEINGKKDKKDNQQPVVSSKNNSEDAKKVSSSISSPVANDLSSKDQADKSDSFIPEKISFKELADIISEKKHNPFLSEPCNATKFKVTEDKQQSLPEQSKNDVLIQIFSGELVRPERFFQLDQAFKKADVKRETPSWVHETHDGIIVLKNKNPMQEGFQQVIHPWKGLFYRTLANIAAPLLRLKIEENSIRLPNGVLVSLMPSSWQDAQGKKINIYEAVGLPDGTWLRLANQSSEEAVPFKDRQQVRKIVEEAVKKFESQGRTREV